MPGAGAVTVLDHAGTPGGWVLVLGHGAGADQSSAFMVAAARALASRGVTVVTFNFPYTEAGRRTPDRGPVLEATFRAVLDDVRAHTPGRVAIGGKSMGGRIASQIAAAGAPAEALVFFGYPLHPPGRPGQQRAAHLPRIAQPMLFLQGSRDAFGTPDELRPILAGLPRATLHVVEGADHGFAVRKKDGRAPADVLAELWDAAARFLSALG